MHTKSGLNLIKDIWCGQKMFKQSYKNWKKSDEVQKQNKTKTMHYNFMLKKWDVHSTGKSEKRKVIIHKKTKQYYIVQITETLSV